MGKKISVAIALGMVGSLLGWGALAQHEYQLLEKIPGVNIQTGPTQFKQYIEGIYAFGIWTVGVAAMFMIIVGGFMYMTSAGNTSRAEAARRTITNALIGLVAALTAYLILYIINPDFVNINIERLSFGTAPTATTPPIAPTTGGQNCSYPDPTAGTRVCAGTSCTLSCTISPTYDVWINSYSSSNGLSSQLVRTVICKESSGRADIVGVTGDCGLMQVMPPSGGTCTSSSMGNLLDPETNIREGTRILAQKYRDVGRFSYTTVTRDEMALAAYNCCANGDNPNEASVDCGAIVPKWACPINPGTSTYNMCSVKSYACGVASCGI